MDGSQTWHALEGFVAPPAYALPPMLQVPDDPELPPDELDAVAEPEVPDDALVAVPEAPVDPVELEFPADVLLEPEPDELVGPVVELLLDDSQEQGSNPEPSILQA